MKHPDERVKHRDHDVPTIPRSSHSPSHTSSPRPRSTHSPASRVQPKPPIPLRGRARPSVPSQGVRTSPQPNPRDAGTGTGGQGHAGRRGSGSGRGSGRGTGGPTGHAGQRRSPTGRPSRPSRAPRPRPRARGHQSTLAQVLSLPRYGVGRMGLRWRKASLRVKLALLLAIAFFSLVALPVGFAYSFNRGNYLSLPSLVTTLDAKDSIRVYRSIQGDVVRVPLNDYLENVLAAEMDPNAPFAALQAAAVAARTYAIRATQHQLFATPTFAQAHGADVTDNGSLDLPWFTAAQQRTRFQSQASADEVRYTQAIASTNGQVLTYQGQPILAFSFQLSPGHTRTGSQVFGVPLPYLAAVACPDDARAAKVNQVVPISRANLTQALGLPIDVNLRKLQVGPRDSTGFVLSVSEGNKSWSGPEFAARLNLQSSNFTIQLDPAPSVPGAASTTARGTPSALGLSGDRSPAASTAPGPPGAPGAPGTSGTPVAGTGILVRTLGIGLDLGMSLHEAAVMAKQGTEWPAILSHFYPGTTLQADTKWTK